MDLFLFNISSWPKAISLAVVLNVFHCTELDLLDKDMNSTLENDYTESLYSYGTCLEYFLQFLVF